MQESGKKALCTWKRTSKVSYENIYKIPTYCPLVWMFCSWSSNNRINPLLERARRIVYNDHIPTFEDRLVKDNSVSIHHRNIHLLAIELYKAKNSLSFQLMLESFQRRELNYNIRSQKDFSLRSVNTSSYGLYSLRYLAPKT